MSRLKSWLVVLLAALAAACASVPPETSEVAAAATVPKAGATALTAAAADAVVLNAEEFDPSSEVVCADMLKPGSNVIVRRCMTRRDWKLFEQMQAQQAQQLLRTWQGGAYR